MEIPHLQYLKSLTIPEFPGFGARLYEALQAVQQQSTNHEQQTNSNPTGQPISPPTPQGVNVSAQNGYVHLAIQDSNEIYRGIQYHVEHDSNPQFTNPIPVSLGTARHTTIAIGNQTRYFRVASSYGSSPPSSWVYHGTAAQPSAVAGGGVNGGPLFLASQSSGTGTPGQGLQGPGTIPYRTASGAAPAR